MGAHCFAKFPSDMLLIRFTSALPCMMFNLTTMSEFYFSFAPFTTFDLQHFILIPSSPLHSCDLLHSILRETNRTKMEPKDTLHLCTHPQTKVNMLKTRQAKHTQQLFFCNSLTKTIQQYDMCENREKLTFPSANPHSVLVLFTSCYTHGNAEQVKPKECSAQRSSFAWRRVHSLGQTAKTDPATSSTWRSCLSGACCEQ